MWEMITHCFQSPTKRYYLAVAGRRLERARACVWTGRRKAYQHLQPHRWERQSHGGYIRRYRSSHIWCGYTEGTEAHSTLLSEVVLNLPAYPPSWRPTSAPKASFPPLMGSAGHPCALPKWREGEGKLPNSGRGHGPGPEETEDTGTNQLLVPRSMAVTVTCCVYYLDMSIKCLNKAMIPEVITYRRRTRDGRGWQR